MKMDIETPVIHSNGSEKKPRQVIPLLELIKRIGYGNLTTLITVLIAGTAFVLNTKSTIAEVPQMKAAQTEHEKKDEQKNEIIINAINNMNQTVIEMKGDLKLVNYKLDDTKKHGFGEYSKETKQAIKNARE